MLQGVLDLQLLEPTTPTRKFLQTLQKVNQVMLDECEQVSTMQFY
jgi:hypothetical protein